MGTRAVIIDFTIFTPSTNLFLVGKMIFEVLPTGGIKTKSYFTALKLFNYLTPWDLFIMSCQVMFIVFTVYFTFEESQQVWVLGEEYLANWWNILDIIVISLSYITIFFGIWRFTHTLNTVEFELEKMNSIEPANFDTALLYENLFTMSGSFLIFVACLKLFKFTSLYKSVTLIIGAIGEVVTELFMVICMTFILISGFAICALVLFGSHVDGFRNFSTSFYSLISIFAGSLDYYAECKYSHSIGAPIFFAVYIPIAGVMFISVFVALIVYGYHCADVAMQLRPDTPFLSDLMWGFFMEILVFLRMRDTIKKLKMRKMIYQNNQDYDSFVRILKRRGWQGIELQLFLKTNGLERGDPITLEQLSELYNEFCLRNNLFVEVEDHDAIYLQLEKVEKLFEFCDQTIVDIMTKVDLLANHLLQDDSKRRFRFDPNV
uniref:Polycystin-2 n=1 Tax=Lygus hesperus TaxID=30085 RepID=A0A0A9Z7V2_LYGHE